MSMEMISKSTTVRADSFVLSAMTPNATVVETICLMTGHQASTLDCQQAKYPVMNHPAPHTSPHLQTKDPMMNHTISPFTLLHSTFPTTSQRPSQSPSLSQLPSSSPSLSPSPQYCFQDMVDDEFWVGELFDAVDNYIRQGCATNPSC